MNSQVDLLSLSISKTSNTIESFQKYSIEANIDEIENLEDYSIFKYAFTILSEPKNIRISVKGTAKVKGNQEERDRVIEKNENDIPKILSIIYQELFPTFFTLSRSANVPCPPYQILELGSKNQINEIEPEVSETETNTSTHNQIKSKGLETENNQSDEDTKENIIESNLEDLQELYQKTSAEYNENPTEENRQKLEKISEQLSKPQQKKTIESSV